VSYLTFYFFTSSILQIIFENRFRNDRERTCKIIVDGTDCAISEPWPWESSFNRQFFSKKLNGAAVKNEFGVCIQTGDIVWVDWPFKAGKWHEIMVYRRNLKGLLHPGEMVEADIVYRGGQQSETQTQFSLDWTNKQRSWRGQGARQ
jgi:hypothetical protein